MSSGSFVDDSTQGIIDELGNGDFAPPNGQTIDLDYEFDTSTATESSLESGGSVDAEGCYHFEIEKVEFNLGVLNDQGKDNTPHILVTCTVLHSVKGQSPAGSKLWHRIYVGTKDGSPLKQGNIDSMERFAWGIGLLKWVSGIKADGNPGNILVHHKKGTAKLSLRDWNESPGRQFMAWVKREKSNDPKYADQFKIPMGKAVPPGHPDVSHIAKNLEAMKLGGYQLADDAVKGQVQSQSEKPAQSSKPAAAGSQKSSPATAAAPAGGSAGLDDIDISGL